MIIELLTPYLEFTGLDVVAFLLVILIFIIVIKRG